VRRSLPKPFQRLRAALTASRTVNPGGQVVRMPAKPTMKVVVHRFQGTYECGCKVPDPSPDASPLCEIHEKPFLYVNEYLGTFAADEVRKED
jgi:hypothetical protein